VPAAAVIPAPIGYINTVAVKKLVVEFLVGFVVAYEMSESLFLSDRLPLCGFLVLMFVYSNVKITTLLLRANWSAQSKLYSFEHISLE